jgi:hypothetical protein
MPGEYDYALRHGRCKPCKLLFEWRATTKRYNLKYAHCPECGKRLSRTCIGLIKDPEVCGRTPIFIGEVK